MRVPGLLSGRLAPKDSPRICATKEVSDAGRPGECSEVMTNLTCRAAALVSRPSVVLSDLTGTSPSLRTIHLDELTDSLTGERRLESTSGMRGSIGQRRDYCSPAAGEVAYGSG